MLIRLPSFHSTIRVIHSFHLGNPWDQVISVLWVYSFDSLFSAPEAGSALPLSVYIGFCDNISLMF